MGMKNIKTKLGLLLPFLVYVLVNAQESSQGLRLFIVDDSPKVLPQTKLGEPHPFDEPVRLQGAGGETVAFQIVLESDTSRKNVEVAVSDLKRGANALPADRFEIFLEHYIDCPPVDPKFVSLGPGAYPDPLIPLWVNGPGTREVAHPIDLLAGQRTVLWVDVRIPRGLASGAYRGSLTLSAGSDTLLRLELALEKYPFDLPAANHLDAWAPLYLTRFYRAQGLDDLDTAGQVEVIWSYFRMAHQHRFVTQFVDYQPKLRWDEETGKLLSADWTSWDYVNGPALDGSLFEDREPPRLFKVGGFVWWGARPGDHPHFGGTKQDRTITAAHRRALGEYAREARRHFDQRGWKTPRLFMYMIDEPDLKTFPNLPGVIAGYGEAIEEAGASVEHLVTMNPAATKKTHGAIDIWADWAAGYYPPVMRARQRLGERAWFYHKHEPFVGGHLINQEGLGLRSWPWIAWRYGVDGVFVWSSNYWNEDPYRNPINWNRDQLGNGVLFYPGAMLSTIGHRPFDGPVPSFRMKALRRGLYDYEYFHLLKSLGGDPDPLVKRVVRSALNEKGWNPIWSHPLWGKHGDWSHDPAEWDEAVREAAREIIERMSR